ncbi:MAG: helix-turn-helix domain-containing protein [Candidatus Accumulibacter sp.]|jgi:cytoskeleton protein RodZ|nr:helix-turn-helix domain-containing protein [Accumulibacter sp.]
MSAGQAVPDSTPSPEPELDGREPVLTDRASDVGQQLRLAREASGVSLVEAATALKLSPYQVEALETNDWFQWPRTVTRGFVRNYARYLKLDAAPFMTELDQVPMRRGAELAVGIDSPVDMPSEGQNNRRDYARVLAGLIILALALLVCFFVPLELWQAGLDSIKTLISDNQTVPDTAEPNTIGQIPEIIPAAPESSNIAIAAITTAAPVDDTATVTPPPLVAQPLLTEPPPSPPVTPVPTPAPPKPAAGIPAAAASSSSSPSSSSDGTLSFSFAQPSWVEVRDGKGQVIFSQTSPAGSQRDIAGQPPFALVVGNASHVALQYKGSRVDLSPRSREDIARLTLE